MGFKTHLTRDSLCPSQKGLTISPTEHHLALGCTQRCLHLPCADASVRAEHFVPLSRKAAAQPTNSHSPSVWDPQQCCAWRGFALLTAQPMKATARAQGCCPRLQNRARALAASSTLSLPLERNPWRVPRLTSSSPPCPGAHWPFPR